MEDKNRLKDLLFALRYEGNILKGILNQNRLERWVPGCSYPYTEREHLARYIWAAKYVRNKFVVDVACGAGKGSNILAALGKAKHVTACDIDRDTLKYASIKYGLPNIEYRNFNAEDLPLKGRSADAMVSFETIEHLKQPEKFLKNATRVLKKSGVLIVSTPIYKLGHNKKPDNRYHFQEWGYEEFARLVGKYFIVKDVFQQKGDLIRKSADGKVTGNYQIIVANNLKNDKAQEYLFVITSAINLRKKRLSYSEIRSVYTTQERITHTLRTIESIRKKIPNARIVLLELGKHPDELAKLKDKVDEFVFLGNNPFVRLAVDGEHKGLGEAVGLIFGCKYIRKYDDYYLFKVSGRYFLDENFKLSEWNENGKKISAKVYDRSISTRLYGFPYSYLNRWFFGLISSIPKLLLGKSIESVMYSKFKDSLQAIPQIGVSGKVAIDGSGIKE